MKQLNWYQIFGKSNIPDGRTVLPTDDIQIWLHCANIWNKSYTTLAEVLADTDTLLALITSNNAVDYMVRSTTWAKGASVPAMTSDTTPSGVASASSIFSSNNYAYKAFDKDTSTRWASQRPISSGGESLEYEFDSACAITKARIYNNTGYPTVGNYRIQNYVDGAWRTLYSGSNSVNNIDEVVTFVNIAKVTKYRLQIDSVTEAEGAINIVELDFISEGVTDNATAMTYIGLNNYCANTLLADETWREAICLSAYFESVLNVKNPIMTDDTHPYGVASATTVFDSNYPAWKAFDNNDSSSWASVSNAVNQRLMYQFVSAQKIYFVKMKVYYGSGLRVKQFAIKASNDGNTFDTLKSLTTLPNTTTTDYQYTINPTMPYLYYALDNMESYIYTVSLHELQFYGRKDI